MTSSLPLYDSLNRLYQVTDWAGNITTFGWRADGVLSSITRPNFSTRTLTYDDAGHLKRIEERSPSGMMQTMLNYKLDAAGRITSTAQFPVPVSAPPALAAMTYDTDNRLATFGGTSCTFDADGNLTSGPLGNATEGTGGFGSYTFDQRNRLTANPGQTRVYDAENNLLSRTDATGTTYHVYAGGAMAQLLTREPPNGTKYYYVYGAGQLLYEISEGGPAPTGLVYYHFDHNGNTIALSNSTGQVVQRNEYSPYGQLTQASANYDTPFLFAGALGVQTSGDGLLYMRARFYNPRMGRFLNADPSGFGGGQNWYRYAGNNPVSLSDPFGLCPGSSESNSIGSQLGYAFGANNPYNPLAIANYVAGRVLSFPGAVMSAVGMTQADQEALAIVTMQPELMLVDTSAIGTQLSANLKIGQTFEGLAGTPMTGWTRHGLNQSISRDAGLGVSTQAIFDALTNPVEIKVTATGSEYIGANARVVLNADGKMITTTATSQAGTRVGAQTSTVTTR